MNYNIKSSSGEILATVTSHDEALMQIDAFKIMADALNVDMTFAIEVEGLGEILLTCPYKVLTKEGTVLGYFPSTATALEYIDLLQQQTDIELHVDKI